MTEEKNTEQKEELKEFLVEVIYLQTYIDKPDTPEAHKQVEVQSQVFSFTNPSKEKARYAAEKEMDKYIRHGMTLRGGSIIKSVIHPSALLQVGLIDMELHKKEQELLAAEAVAGAVGTDVPPVLPTEPTEVGVVEAD